MKFPTRYNMRRAIGETDFTASLTVPNQSMTVLEILHRFAQGVDPGISKVPIYDGEDFEDPFSNPDFDLADISPSELSEQIISSQNKLESLKNDEVNKRDNDSNDDANKTTS